MAGHMGAVRNTTQNIEVVDVDDVDGAVLLKGSVPGPKNGWVLVSDSIKSKLPDDVPFPAGLLSRAEDKEELEVSAKDSDQPGSNPSIDEGSDLEIGSIDTDKAATTEIEKD